MHWALCADSLTSWRWTVAPAYIQLVWLIESLDVVGGIIHACPSFLFHLSNHVCYGACPLHGTARYGSVRFTFGVFSTGYCTWYLVLFLVPPRQRFQAIRTVTKTWRVNSADHWLAGENRHYWVTELATRDPPLQPDPLDLNQHSRRRIGRTFCLNKRTFLHQPQNSCFVLCWGSTNATETVQRKSRW